MTRGKVLQLVAEYFASKGHYMTYKEYRHQPDRPISTVLILRVLGSWNRLPVNIKRYFPELAEQIDFTKQMEVFMAEAAEANANFVELPPTVVVEEVAFTEEPPVEKPVPKKTRGK